MKDGKIEAVQRPLINENNALRKRVAELEASVREAHRALAASYGNAGHAFNVLGAALAKTPMASVSGDDGGHIGAMPGYDPLTRSVSEPRPNTTRGLCPECLDDSGLDSLYKYGVMTEHLAQLAAALGLREGKHTADSVARIAIERLVLAPRSDTALIDVARRERDDAREIAASCCDYLAWLMENGAGGTAEERLRQAARMIRAGDDKRALVTGSGGA